MMRISTACRFWAWGLLFACGTLAMSLAMPVPANPENSAEKRDQYAALKKVPDKARARQNPMEGDREATEAGKKLFAEHCAECHGVTAEGGRTGPGLRVQEIGNATPGALFWILSNGVVRRGMPVWSNLPEPERWQLVSFLKSLTPATTAEPESAHDQEGKLH